MKAKLWYHLADIIVIVTLSTGVCFGMYFLYQKISGHMMSLLLIIITSFLTTWVVEGLIELERWTGKHYDNDKEI